MNKDVIYIEPEDDITDIISRIKSSKQKIVALVPPKKLGVMRSAVNTKLIAKTGKNEDKAIVIVTTDPSLVKISALSGLPVAKTLNSRPVLPSEFKKKKPEPEEISDEDMEGEVSEDIEDVETEAPKPKKTTKKSDVEIDSDELEEDDDKNKKKKDSKLTQKIPNFDRYRKLIVFGGIGGVLLIAVLVWAFAIAPAIEILVKMKTTSTSISENVELVTDQAKVDNKAGKFLLEQVKYEDEDSIEFEPTGKANKGEKASGTVMVYAIFSQDKTSGSATLPSGSTITITGKKYVTTAATSIEWNGMSASCDQRSDNLCYVKAKDNIKVVASDSGAAYNIAASNSGAVNVNGFAFVSSSAMAGGTDKEVTVVSEDDIKDAASQLADNSDAKEKLMSLINEGEMVKIDASYKVDTKDPVSSPKKNEEVKEGQKAKLTAKTIYTIYVVDRHAIDEFITNYEADKLGSGDKIYTTGNPFFERFLDGGKGTFTAKLKATIKTGPELSETQVLETAKGVKNGEAQARIKDLNHGIKDVKVNPNFPWVYAVPSDPNRVTIKIEVEGEE